MSVFDVVGAFRNEGWTLVRLPDDSDYNAYLAAVDALAKSEFLIDFHIKDLLVFPPKTELHSHALYLNSSIILQDKASCLASKLLNPPEGSTVLDMCAAPGLKTAHLAALMKNTGTIYAVERDERRFATLTKFVNAFGATCVKTIYGDAMTLTNNHLPDVEYILLDPSCSGSGVISDFQVKIMGNERLSRLVKFQISILKHALRNFPSVKRIVYSTCSLLLEENEEVVETVLSMHPNYKLLSCKELLDNQWTNVGSSILDVGPKCLYALPEKDYTNGFFVAVFERCGDAPNMTDIKIEETNENPQKLLESEEDKQEQIQGINEALNVAKLPENLEKEELAEVKISEKAGEQIINNQKAEKRATRMKVFKREGVNKKFGRSIKLKKMLDAAENTKMEMPQEVGKYVKIAKKANFKIGKLKRTPKKSIKRLAEKTTNESKKTIKSTFQTKKRNLKLKNVKA